ncbi:hypothetical protein TNCV_3501041 [Trichonephila clavipes]|nr:hypothetical protein TNCV_3501041 [Trichonephila clavipes]
MCPDLHPPDLIGVEPPKLWSTRLKLNELRHPAGSVNNIDNTMLSSVSGTGTVTSIYYCNQAFNTLVTNVDLPRRRGSLMTLPKRFLDKSGILILFNKLNTILNV